MAGRVSIMNPDSAAIGICEVNFRLGGIQFRNEYGGGKTNEPELICMRRKRGVCNRDPITTIIAGGVARIVQPAGILGLRDEFFGDHYFAGRNSMVPVERESGYSHAAAGHD